MTVTSIRAGLLLRSFLQVFIFLSSGFAQAESSFNMVASIRPLSLLAQDLTQGLPATVTTLLPANADPHSWALRISDRHILANTDLVLWLGPEFEAFLAKPLAGKGAKQIQLGELPDLRWTSAEAHDHGHEHHYGRDLHIWLDPANAVVIQKALAARIAEQRPDWRTALELRLKQQVEQLELLQKQIHERLSPHRGKGFIAYHDTYGHFVKVFGLNQLGAVNQSSEQALSAKSLHDLQKRALDAHCLLVEKKGGQEERMARLLKLPLVVADGLAREADRQSALDFLLGISAAFETCFAGRSTAGDQ